MAVHGVKSPDEVDPLDLDVDDCEAMAGGGLGDGSAVSEEDRATVFLSEDDEAVY